MSSLQTADRVSHLQESYLREILSVASRRDIISFAGGLPAEACFPLALFKQLERSETVPGYLQYGGSQGLDILLEVLRTRYGLAGDQDILMTSGAQQGLDLVLRTFVNPRDKIAVEIPCYLGALQAFRLAGAEICPLPLLGGIPEHAEEARLAELESLFRQEQIKFFYAVTDFHNPTGGSYSLKMREAVIRLCEKYGVFLIEDAPYRELRFTGEPLPMLADLSPQQCLVLRSFSKVVSPGLRLGCIQAEKRAIREIMKVKQVADLHTQLPGQASLAGLLMNPDFNQHLQTLRQEYLCRYSAMHSAIKRYFPGWVTPCKTEGGMFIWLDLSCEASQQAFSDTDDRQLAEMALTEGVAVVPGSVFYPNRQAGVSFRLNFSHESVVNIDHGIQRFSRVFKRQRLRSGGAD